MCRELAEWLLENGGPVVRYRTATELLSDASMVDIEALDRDLLNCPLVRLWLGRLKNVKAVHDRGNDRFVSRILGIGRAYFQMRWNNSDFVALRSNVSVAS